MSDRIAVMNEGKVLQMGKPADIYEHPSNRFVADFIGETNLLPARVLSTEPDVTVEIAGGLSVLASSIEEGLTAGSSAVLSVRPEKLNLLEPGDPMLDIASHAIVPGRIESLVYVGTDTHHTIRVADGTTLVARVQNFHVDEEPWEPGESVIVQWDAAHARVLQE